MHPNPASFETLQARWESERAAILAEKTAALQRLAEGILSAAAPFDPSRTAAPRLDLPRARKLARHSGSPAERRYQRHRNAETALRANGWLRGPVVVSSASK